MLCTSTHHATDLLGWYVRPSIGQFTVRLGSTESAPCRGSARSGQHSSRCRFQHERPASCCAGARCPGCMRPSAAQPAPQSCPCRTLSTCSSSSTALWPARVDWEARAATKCSQHEQPAICVQQRAQESAPPGQEVVFPMVVDEGEDGRNVRMQLVRCLRVGGPLAELWKH